MKTPAIIARLFRPATKGAADPFQPWTALFGGGGLGGVNLSVDQALQVTAVKAAVTVISEAAASLDVMVKAIAADGTETNVPDHPALALLRGAANDWTSGFELIRDLMIDALTDDRGGLVYVNRAGSGAIVELIRYRSGTINVDLDQNTGEPSYKINNTAVAAADMIHLRNPFGRCALTLAARAIHVAYVLERHAINLFGKGARPSGALTFPQNMGKDAVEGMRTAWKAIHEAEGESGKTAILYDGANFQPLTFNSTDAQFLENRKFQIAEIARAFRVPPSMLFDLDRATWGNTEQLGKEFLTYCLEPWLRALEGALRRALFSDGDRGRYAIRFDRDDMTRADLATRATVINSLIATKVINPNEGRSWLGMEPRAGGEIFENPNITTEPPKVQNATE